MAGITDLGSPQIVIRKSFPLEQSANSPVPGQFVTENQFKYAIFNAGPRLCLGKTFAYMQMKMVAATILQRYEVVFFPILVTRG